MSRCRNTFSIFMGNDMAVFPMKKQKQKQKQKKKVNLRFMKVFLKCNKSIKCFIF